METLTLDGETKKCSKCKVVKLTTEFGKDRTRKSGLHYYCKPCQSSYKTPEKLSAWRKTPSGRYSEKRKDAKKRGLDFKLTLEDFHDFYKTPCHYCGDDIGSVHLDRKDSSKGYVIDNVVSCCHRCNIHKSVKSYEEFLKVLECKNEIVHNKDGTTIIIIKERDGSCHHSVVDTEVYHNNSISTYEWEVVPGRNYPGAGKHVVRARFKWDSPIPGRCQQGIFLNQIVAGDMYGSELQAYNLDDNGLNNLSENISVYDPSTHRRCCRCRKVATHNEFYRDSSRGENGLQPRCKTCSCEESMAYHAANKKRKD